MGEGRTELYEVMLKVRTVRDLAKKAARKAWDPAMPVAVGLTAQATQPAVVGGGARKAMEREEFLGL